MEHRGKRYTVVQGIEPASWKWPVYLDENTVKSGSAPTRQAAKTKAICTIDRARPSKKIKHMSE
jgi:precorrin isomerase